MHDVYRQPAELPREVVPAPAAVEAPAIVVAARADDADELSFVREGPYDESALDGPMDRTRYALAIGTGFVTTLAALVSLLATR
jgi:hypothetical protein